MSLFFFVALLPCIILRIPRSSCSSWLFVSSLSLSAFAYRSGDVSMRLRTPSAVPAAVAAPAAVLFAAAAAASSGQWRLTPTFVAEALSS